MIKRIEKLTASAIKADKKRALRDSRFYEDAGQWLNLLDADFDLAPGTAAGFVAALSPLNLWEDQLRFTPPSIAACLALIKSGNHPLPGIRGQGFLANRDKACRILLGESPLDVLGGDKVRAFYRNLTGDYTCVTIDRHAIAATGYAGKGLSSAGVPTSKLYRRLEFVYRFAGERFNLTGPECQAIVWCYWRRTHAHFAENNKRKGI